MYAPKICHKKTAVFTGNLVKQHKSLQNIVTASARSVKVKRHCKTCVSAHPCVCVCGGVDCVLTAVCWYPMSLQK